MELRLSAVVAVGGVHRTDDGQFVHVARDVGKPVAHLDSALAVLLKSNLQRVDFVSLVSISIRDYQSLECKFLGILHIGERCFSDRFTLVLRKHGLGIKTLHVAHATVHKEPDHTLRLGRQVWQAGGRRP